MEMSAPVPPSSRASTMTAGQKMQIWASILLTMAALAVIVLLLTRR
jgi:hypothetical protein